MSVLQRDGTGVFQLHQ